MTAAAKLIVRATLVSCALALAVGVGAARPASAASPCWKQLLNDWYDGRIDKIYAVHCYEEALGHLPTDVQIYSSARDDIQRALASAIQREKGGKGTASSPGGGTTSGPGGADPGTTTPAATVPTETTPTETGRTPANGPFGEALDKLNPGSAESLPLPLLILGGLAILLVGAGLAGMIVRRGQTR